jgi:hypothetical protein
MLPNKLLVKRILETATQHEWSLQGFGMLRLYLSREVRLHIWDNRYQIDDVSIIHNHPWHFRSEVIAGQMLNTNYYVHSGDTHFMQKIKPGEDCTALSKPEPVLLEPTSHVCYDEGQMYVQDAPTLHESIFEDGTITLVSRWGRESHQDEALSAWPSNLGEDGWVSAAPRLATDEEVLDITGRALERWYAGIGVAAA